MIKIVRIISDKKREWSMKALLLTGGSRGDVQPFIALAQGLQLAGHTVVLGAPESSKSLAEAYGVKFFPLEDTTRKMMADPDRGHITETERVRIGHAGKFKAKYSDSYSLQLEQMAALTEREGADILVHHHGVPGKNTADRIGVPAVPVLLQPGLFPTSLVPHIVTHFVLKRPLPRRLNRASYFLVPILTNVIAGAVRLRYPGQFPTRRPQSDPFQDNHGRPRTVLQAFSRHILPGPLDFPESVHTTGYWFLPRLPNWRPPMDLCEFIAAGDAPVCIGFGSIVGADPERTGRIVSEALQKAQVRAVVVTGWGGIDPRELSSSDAFAIDQIPYDWLFPQMAAVVHASGAGVSSAALAAGRPQVPCPYSFDQPFWARLMHARGVATPPLPQHELNSDTLADAIRQAITDEVMAQRADELAEHISTEDGVATAITTLESLTAHVDKPR